MMRFIIKKSLQFRFLVIAISVALMYLGTRQLQNAPVDVFPEFAPPRVEIQVPSLGLSASEVEQLVTIPIEDALNGIEGLDVMRSKSVAALSAINLIFKRGTDLLLARQLVHERLATVTPTLPSWTSPPVMMPALSSTSRFMKIGVSSSTLSVIDLSMISYWKIRTRLLRVPGVSNVMIYGERLKMYQVQVEPDKLAANNLPLKAVHETVGDALDASLVSFSDGAVIGSGGFIDTPNQRLSIRHVLPIVTPEDLGRITIKGRPDLKLTDVARLVEDHQPLIGDAIINDGPGILLIVEKFPWANTLDVTRGVDEALKEMAPGLQGINVDPEIFRPATFIQVSIGNLTNALILGSVLVMVILFFFLFEWRTALISVIAIPLSLLTAGLILDLRGTTINVMILAGMIIAVGDVVDDAIIDIENIWRRLRQRRSEGSTQSLASIILDASIEVRGAIIYATLLAHGRAGAGILSRGIVRRFLPAARHFLYPRRPRLDGRCAHSNAGARLPSSSQRAARTALLTGCAVAAKDLPGHPRQDHSKAALRLRHRRGDRPHRRADPAGPWPRAAAGVQGTGLSDALADQARYIAAGNGAHHHAGQRGAPRGPRRPELWRPHRSGPSFG